MTFDEACELARVIQGNSAFVVIAIGRFKPPQEILDCSPWGISISSRISESKFVIWNESDWRRTAAPAKQQKPDPVKEDSGKSIEKQHSAAEQLSLF